MDGAFACPECGCEIRLTGLSPGRRVRCDWCRSWVEVPFLPRAEPIKRMRTDRASRRRRRRAWIQAATVAAAVALVVVGFGARQALRSRARSAQAEKLTNLVEASRQAEKEGRLGEALAEAEAALAFAQRCARPPHNLDDLRRRRADLARREAESQLDALDGGAGGPHDDPARAVGQALTLLARVEKDGALAGLEARLDATLDRLRLRWVEADAAAAREAEEAGRAGEAYDRVVRQHQTAGALPPALRAHWQADAAALARRLIARQGTLVDPIHGQFTLGTSSGYDATLRASIDAALRAAGYLPRPPSTPWEEVWSSSAPYRVRVEVVERQEGRYLGSPNRLSKVEARFTLTRQGDRLWYVEAHATTAIPVPGLPAYQASRIASSSRRDPGVERLLHANARDLFVERVRAVLRNVPAFPPAALPSAAAS